MPVTVRNASDTVVVLSTLDKTQPHITWMPKRDEVESIQQCPDALVDTVPFHKAVALGILVVAEDGALKEAIERQAERYRSGLKNVSDATERLIAEATTQRNGTVVISEEDIDRHINSLSKAQPSTLALEPSN